MWILTNKKSFLMMSVALLIIAADTQGYLQFLGVAESGNNPNAAANCAGCTAQGKFQMTNAALVQTGYMNANGTYTGKDGVNSQADYRANPQAQYNSMLQYQQFDWKQIQSQGSEKYIGQTVNGITWNQSALLDCYYVMGTGGCPTYLATGQISQAALNSNPNAASAFRNRFAQASQTDASAVTNSATTDVTNSYNPVAPGDANGQTGLGGNGGTIDAACSQAITKALSDNASAVVASQVALATNATSGYTLLGGNDVMSVAGLSASGGSGTGMDSYIGMSCLDNLLSGSLDIIFNPPSLGSLIDMILNAVCNKVTSMVRTEVSSLTSTVTNNVSLGGYFPGLSSANVGGIDFGSMVGSQLSNMVTTGGGSGNGINFTVNGAGGSTTYNTGFSQVMSGTLFSTTSRVTTINTINSQSSFTRGLLGQ